MSNHITLADLIQQLTELSEELASAGHDATEVHVKMHTQPNYPLLHSVANVTVLAENGTYHVALAEGSCDYDENPYGSRQAWEHHDCLPDLDSDEEA